MFQADIQTQERTFQIEDGKKKMMMIIFTSFLFTIPQRWHSVCWLSSSLFRVFVYFLLLQVSASDRNWFPVLQLCVYSILRFSFTQFIASVRCVEWANCYFWVIIAAMFVCLCLARDDLCLAHRPVAWHCSGFLLPGSAIFFLSAERERRVSEESLINFPHKASSVPVKCPLVLCGDGHNEW